MDGAASLASKCAPASLVYSLKPMALSLLRLSTVHRQAALCHLLFSLISGEDLIEVVLCVMVVI